jgi:hypothetical protein
MRMAKGYGRKGDGTPITEEMVEAMADEAEQGYDLDAVRSARQGGRPPLGASAASVESVRLDPELKRDLLLRAAQDGTSMSEVIRKALREYVRAS